MVGLGANLDDSDGGLSRWLGFLGKVGTLVSHLVEHASNLSTQEAEAGRSKFEASPAWSTE